jgi:hypothetical protein
MNTTTQEQTLKTFAEHLNYYLLKAKDKNPSFSLRALARFLNIDAGFLSHIMKGKKKASYKIIETFTLLTGVDPHDILEWHHFQEASPSPTHHLPKIDEWHLHTALYEDETQQILAFIDFFKHAKAEDIAIFLNLSEEKTKLRLQELITLKIISVTPSGEAFIHAKDFSVPPETKNLLLRKFHRYHLERTLKALNDIPFDKRDFQGHYFMCHPTLFNQLKKDLFILLSNITEESEALLKQQPHLSPHIYYLGAQLAPLNFKE